MSFTSWRTLGPNTCSGCTAGHGDNPPEDYNPEFPEDPVPFDREAINKTLRRL
jgi:hypothetical protein